MSVPKAIEFPTVLNVKVTFSDPSKDTTPLASPSTVIVLAVVHCAADAACPFKLPTNSVA